MSYDLHKAFFYTRNFILIKKSKKIFFQIFLPVNPKIQQKENNYFFQK